MERGSTAHYFVTINLTGHLADQRNNNHQIHNYFSYPLLQLDFLGWMDSHCSGVVHLQMNSVVTYM